MTNNEALKILSDMKGAGLEWDKAIDLAIEALECNDIIACGDCKHWICHDRRCGYWNHGVKPLEWCCHAERRTDDSIPD